VQECFAEIYTNDRYMIAAAAAYDLAAFVL
jgi:hypothetical protein